MIGVLTSSWAIGNASTLPNNFDIQGFMKENFNTVFESLKGVRQEVSEQGGPADSRVIGRLEDIATWLGRLEESDRGRQAAIDRQDEKMNLIKDTLDTIVTQLNFGGQSVTSGETLSQRLDALKNTIAQNDQKVDGRLGKCEVRINTFDELKSSIQGLVQQNKQEADEKLKNYEMRSNKKMDSITERVDQFGSLMDTLTTNNINSKMMSADNSEKIVALTNQLEPLKEFKIKGEEQLTRSASSIVDNSDQITALTNQLEPLKELKTKGEQQFTELQQKLDSKEARTETSTGKIAFNCYRTSIFESGIVTYNGCHFDYSEGAMNYNTGKFQAKKAGLYKFHFVGEVYPGKSGCIDIMNASTRVSRLYSTGFAGKHRNLSGSVIAKMNAGDELYAQACDSGYKLYAATTHPLIFGGFFLAPL